MSTILTATTTATVTIDGTDYALASNESITLTDDEAVKQVVKVPTSETTIANLGSVGPASLEGLSYLLVVNRDATNFIRLRLSDTGGHTVDVKVGPSQCFVFKNRDLNVSTTEGAFASFSQIDNIKAQADTAECSVELLMAY